MKSEISSESGSMVQHACLPFVSISPSLCLFSLSYSLGTGEMVGRSDGQPRSRASTPILAVCYRNSEASHRGVWRPSTPLNGGEERSGRASGRDPRRAPSQLLHVPGALCCVEFGGAFVVSTLGCCRDGEAVLCHALFMMVVERDRIFSFFSGWLIE